MFVFLGVQIYAAEIRKTVGVISFNPKRSVGVKTISFRLGRCNVN
jgi:hypothetical protein